MTAFKITVVFGQLKLIIPCNPDDCVRDLIDKSCIRYKKATKKPSVHQVAIAHLKTSKDGAILDDDDLLRDVLDDREQVIAVYEENEAYLDRSKPVEAITNSNNNNTNGLDNSLTSSNNSGDDGRINLAASTANNTNKQHIIATTHVKDGNRRRPLPLSGSSENMGDKEQYTVGVVVKEADFAASKGNGLVVRRGSESFLKVEAAVLAPLPNGATLSSPGSGEASPLPPGLLDNEAKVSNHRRWSLTVAPSPTQLDEKQTKAGVTIDHSKIKNVENEKEKQPVSGSPIPAHLQPSAFQRDGPARRSAVADPEKWLQSQSVTAGFTVGNPQIKTVPMQEVERNIDQRSSGSSILSASSTCSSPVPVTGPGAANGICPITGEPYETIRLKQEAGALGIHVVPRVLQHSKLHMGLYLQAVEPQGRVGKANLLAPGDCIIAVNGVSLLEMPFSSAQETFRNELQHPVDYLQLRVVRKDQAVFTTTFKPQPEPNNVETVLTTSKTEVKADERSVLDNNDALKPSNVGLKTSSLTASGRKIRKRVEISLVKGSEGLGFTLASRDNETNPTDRQVVVKHIQAKGVAAVDGRLRSGDRIIEINGRAITDLTHSQAVALLKGFPEGATINFIITRLVDVSESETSRPTVSRKTTTPRTESASPTQQEQQQNEMPVTESVPLPAPSGSLRQYLTYDIQLNDTGSAGLGVSLKASSKTTAQNLTHDLGIFIMKIIHGGAAHKDGNLRPNDQLVEVNGVSLLGKTNADAMDTLKQAILVPGPRPGYIRIRVARVCNTDASSSSDEQLPSANTSAIVDQCPADSFVDEVYLISNSDSTVANRDQLSERPVVFVDACPGGIFVRPAPRLSHLYPSFMMKKTNEGADLENMFDSETGADVFTREGRLRQSVSEKRHNIYADPRGSEAYRKLLEIKQPKAQDGSPLQQAATRPKSVEPEHRVISPSTRVISPPVIRPKPPVTGQPQSLPSATVHHRRSNSLESVTTTVPPSQQRHTGTATLSTNHAGYSPPGGPSTFTRKSSLNQSFRSAVDRSARTQVNEGFEDSTVRGGGSTAVASSPDRNGTVRSRSGGPSMQSSFMPVAPATVIANPPATTVVQQQRPTAAIAPSTAASAGASNTGSGGFKGFFRLGKGSQVTNQPALSSRTLSPATPADTHHRQKFYDIERAKQQKMLYDQQQQQQQQQQQPPIYSTATAAAVNSSSQRPSTTSLHSLPATLVPSHHYQPQDGHSAYHNSQEYQQRLQQQTAIVSPPRVIVPTQGGDLSGLHNKQQNQQHQYATINPGIRQPPSYYQHQQMVQQQQQQQHHMQQTQSQPLLQPIGRQQQQQQQQQQAFSGGTGAFQPPVPRQQAIQPQPAVAALTQHIPPSAAPPARQQEIIYARPQRPINPPQYPALANAAPTSQPVMGVSSVQSRYTMPETVQMSSSAYSSVVNQTAYRTNGFHQSPQQQQQQIINTASSYSSMNGGVLANRQAYGMPSNMASPPIHHQQHHQRQQQQQQQQQQTFGYTQLSPTARV